MSNADSPETTAANPSGGERTVIRLAEEELSIRKDIRETGRVRITTVTREREEMVDELLAREQVEVETVAIGKPIEAMPAVRTEGETVVIPVVEEVLVVERRLILKEELHIRRKHTTERHQERVTLRRQEALISRLPVDAEGVKADSSSPDRLGNS